MDFAAIARNTWHQLTHRTPASLVPHLLTNNDPPSLQDLELIQETISMARTNIFDAQSKYPGEVLSSSLLKQVETLQEFIHVHESLLSVLRRVPPEIWGLIFEHALPDNYLIGCPNISLTIKFTRVCRLWRSVALSTPHLWGGLPSFWLTRKRAQDPKYLRHLRKILERGRKTPIAFLASAPYEEVEAHPLLTLLVTQSNRWEHAIIRTTGITMEGLKISGKLSLLHTLELELNNVKVFPKIVTVFRDAPSLRVVKIEALWPVKVEFPWHQLEEYSESNAAKTVGIPHILRHSTNLQKLSYFTYFLGVTSEEFPHTTFLKLTTLRLHFYRDGMDFGPLLNNVTLPALGDLQISNRGGSLIDQLIDLVRRSMCTLQRLAISTLPLQMPAGKLTELLRLTPCLQELDVNDIPAEDLKYLSQTHIVPCLRRLIVHFNPSWYFRPSPVDPQGLNTLAQSRCLPDQTLFQNEERSYVPLEELRLVFPVPQECLSSHTALEGWDQVPRSESDWHSLSECREELEEMLPPKYQETYPRKKKVMINLSQLYAIFRTLGDLESVDSRIILQSNVIYYLQKIMDPPFFSYRVPKSCRNLVREKVATLERILCTRAEQDNLMLHWIRRGQESLIYHPTRTSSTKEFLYGIPEPLTREELFWPTYQHKH